MGHTGFTIEQKGIRFHLKICGDDKCAIIWLRDEKADLGFFCLDGEGILELIAFLGHCADRIHRHKEKDTD